MSTQTSLSALPEAATLAVPGQHPAQGSAPSSGAKKQRLIGIDVSRGLALLGMMAVHALVPYDEDFNPNWVSYIATGNAAAVFALLAGVGLSLTTGRAVVPRSRAAATVASVAARAAAIGVVGLLLGYTQAQIAGVILPYYAVMFLLSIPLLFLRTRTLVLVVILAAVAVPVLSEMFRPMLPEATLANPSFRYLFDHPLALLSELTVTGAYPALPWVSYICSGLIVGRLTLSSAKVARRMVAFGAALGISAVAASWYLLGPLGGRAALLLAAPGPLNPDGDTVDDVLTFGFDGTTPTGSWWWLATSAPHAATPLDLLRTIGTAVAVLGALLLLGHIAAPTLRRVINVVTAPLAAAGSMTLTLYTAHVMFMNSPLDQFGPVGGYAFQVVAVLLFALGWRQAVGRGPLESAVTAVATRARTWAEQATSQRQRAASTGRSAVPASPEQESWSWWRKAEGFAPEASRASPTGHPRRAAAPESAAARRQARTTQDHKPWSWWAEGADGSHPDSAQTSDTEILSWGSSSNPDKPTPRGDLR